MPGQIVEVVAKKRITAVSAANAARYDVLMTEKNITGPLTGVKVVDLSRILAGPWATQVLGDLGAEIIKIERPGKGDDTRQWGPPFLTTDTGQTTDAAYFLAANRNKRSVTIDIAKPDGADIVRSLIRDADILVENFKMGKLAKYHLDYKAISKINPKLVYCSITGFGQTGPYADRPGYDFMIQAMGGLMSVTGPADATSGAEPVRTGVAVADLFSGMYAANAILAALRHAERTGDGQHLDVSLFDCQAAMLANQAANYLVSGVVPGRTGNCHPNIAPYQVLETKDGHMVITVGNDTQFRSFAGCIGDESLADDERFTTNAQRVTNLRALIDLIQPAMKTRSTADWNAIFANANVPAGPINTVDAVFADPHAQTRSLTAPIEREDADGIQMVLHPVKYSKTPTQTSHPPPQLGEGTIDVLSKLFSEEDLARLKADGVIG